MAIGVCFKMKHLELHRGKLWFKSGRVVLERTPDNKLG